MTLRHAPTIALVSWYLMMPPIKLNGVDVSAPLSSWTVYQDYDSFRACFAGETELRKRAEEDPSVQPQLQFPLKQLQQFGAADCIDSDDSRLKAN